ncbi:MAG: hypothetical protein ACXVGK_04885 [Mycobacteriaceae bacterium]
MLHVRASPPGGGVCEAGALSPWRVASAQAARGPLAAHQYAGPRLLCPVDGSALGSLSKSDVAVALSDVPASAAVYAECGSQASAERKARGAEETGAMTGTLALLLGWEVAKPWRLACADVDRASGVCARISRGRRNAAGRPCGHCRPTHAACRVW